MIGFLFWKLDVIIDMPHVLMIFIPQGLVIAFVAAVFFFPIFLLYYFMSIAFLRHGIRSFFIWSVSLLFIIQPYVFIFFGKVEVLFFCFFGSLYMGVLMCSAVRRYCALQDCNALVNSGV